MIHYFLICKWLTYIYFKSIRNGNNINYHWVYVEACLYFPINKIQLQNLFIFIFFFFVFKNNLFQTLICKKNMHNL